jgi:hypothetical protein
MTASRSSKRHLAEQRGNRAAGQTYVTGDLYKPDMQMFAGDANWQAVNVAADRTSVNGLFTCESVFQASR